MNKTTKSFYENPDDKAWKLVDVTGRTVGSVATEIASILRGKHKATYTPQTDNGDFVVAINTDKLIFTGKKLQQKKYFHYTGYIGGMKEITAEKQMAKDSREVLIHAVKGMLPKGPLGRRMLTKLKPFKDQQHSHAAQNPS